MKLTYNQKIYVHIFTIFFVLFGALETVIRQIFNQSILDVIPNTIIKMGLAIVIGLSLVYHFFNKYTYLPFLNYNVLPHALLKYDKVTDIASTPANTPISVNLDIPNDASYISVLYWASQEKTQDSILNNWDVAYGDFSNGGVKSIDPNSSSITVQIKCPKPYTVPSIVRTKTLPQHIHYRFVTSDGMMSRVFTKNVVC